jgi:hypothetical protein
MEDSPAFSRNWELHQERLLLKLTTLSFAPEIIRIAVRTQAFALSFLFLRGGGFDILFQNDRLSLGP